jgi:NAD(P)-dependent dehydrogenase (short-subunit alcohol dehydrogenase family)
MDELVGGRSDIERNESRARGKAQPGQNLGAVIIGGAGSAGQSFAAALRKHGVPTVLADKDEIELARLGSDDATETYRVDALDEQQIAHMLECCEAQLGSIDMLVNVAGRGYVRTLAMMRASQAFSERPRSTIGYVVNVAAPGDECGGPITYASSEVAFDRLSEGLTGALDNPNIRVLTLHRPGSDGAVADLVGRICNEIRGEPNRPIQGTQRAADH